MQASVHYLTLKQSGYDELNTAVTFYHDKTHFNTQNENPYAKYTESLHAAQGRTFMLHNKKAALPSKMTMIKEKVKEFDDLLGKTYTNSSVDGVSSPIVKVIWITASLVLLVLQDGHLVWIHVDPVSSELLQILVDKSLVQVSPAKLSGTIICDALLYLNTSAAKIDIHEFGPKLIFAYLDKSRLDIIGFGRSANFVSYLHGTDIKLEKLQSFDPTIAFMDFSCPTTYRIEKHLFHSLGDVSANPSHVQSFVLWWPNDGQIVWTPSIAPSSLEKDDLSTNVIVVSHNRMQDSLIQHQFKSTGLLLKINYLNESALIAVEQSESITQQFVINIYRYDLTSEVMSRPSIHSAQHSFKNIIFTFNLSSKIKFVSNLSSSKRFLIMISNDLSVYLCDLVRKIAHKYTLTTEQFTTTNLKAEWVVSDFVFCIYDINSKLSFYDIAFNQIDLEYANREGTHIKSLSENLNADVFDLKNNNYFAHFITHSSMLLDTLSVAFVFQKGPFGILHLTLPNTFNELALVSLYLKSDTSDSAKCSQSILKAVTLLNKLDWDTRGEICVLCFNKILNFLLSEDIPFNLQTQMFIEQTLASFYTPQRPISEKTIETYKYIVTRYARRFFYQLLRHENFDKAFLLAVDIGAKDLFNDLYYCALDRQEMQLAEICRRKYKEMAADELQQHYKSQQAKGSTMSINQLAASETDLDIYTVTDYSTETDNEDNDEETYSDDSYTSSFNDDIQVSNLSMNKHVDKIYTEKQLRNVNQDLIKQNEALISATKTSTISFTNFNF